MTAKLAPPRTPEEKRAYAAEAIYLKTRWSNLTGGYVKTDKTVADRPAYLNDEDNTWIIYDERKAHWVVAAGCSSKASKYSSVCSLKTDVFSPDLTGWRRDITAVKVAPRREDHSQGGWMDESFPHNAKSIGRKKA